MILIIFNKIADFIRGIKKADDHVKDCLKKMESKGSKLQHLKSFLDNNKTYEFNKDKDFVFMSIPLSITDIKITEELKKRSTAVPHIYLDDKISKGIEVEKNVRAYLLKSLNDKTLDIPTNAIESTAAQFKTNVIKFLYDKNLTMENFENKKKLVMKYFDTLPQDIKTELIKKYPIFLEK